MALMKYPPVPKILKRVPLYLADMSDAQWDASVLWYSKLPLKEIRRRQDITIGQREDLYQRIKGRRRDMTAQESMAWNNLSIMEDILTQAAMRKLPRYRRNPAIDVHALVRYFIKDEEKGIHEYEKLLRAISRDRDSVRYRFVIEGILKDEKRHIAALKAIRGE
jgi:hypothetical protein